METAFSRSLKSNRLLLNAMLRMDLNDDLVTRPFQALGLDGLLLYVEGMASGNQIGESILRPLLRCPQTLTGRAALETAARQIILLRRLICMCKNAQNENIKIKHNADCSVFTKNILTT